ncbi:hypothetical protein Q3G72_034662 [Acer saccharum]|nr:hypothetical protein Q3G72_005954 [Acer saccharum]KAK1583630.1 hypothetical protein Q3G72_025679 [Acer saccharum]KAK1584632.1 hypothetical protein Q3G72_034662 [Acer saccharum]
MGTQGKQQWLRQDRHSRKRCRDLSRLNLSDVGYTFLESLSRFFGNNDIVFAGVHMQKDLVMLQKRYKIEVRNFVDLSQLASKLFNRPRLSVCGLRELARELGKPRLLNACS